MTPIFRISPVEKWREIRSSRRLAAGVRSPQSAGVSHNVMDAAAGLAVYRGDAYPAEYRGQVLVGCSQNNLIHRRTLVPQGVTFSSSRADKDAEFVSSTDTWFRPVNCVHAPDGTLFVLDMSREVIESIHIAHDVVAHLDLTSGRDRGRIYRLAPPGFTPKPPPKLGEAASAELAQYLEHPSGWWRDTASRLIFERQDRSISDTLRRRLREAPSDVGRMHVLWALEGLGALEDDDLLAALDDKSPHVQDHAVRLAAARNTQSAAIVERLLALAADDDAGVRFQVAFALGEIDDPRRVAALARIAVRDVDDHWMQTAVLSSCLTVTDGLLAELAESPAFLKEQPAAAWLEQIAAIAGARHELREVQHALDVAADLPGHSPAQQAIVLGLGTGLRRAGDSLATVKGDASAAAAGMLTELAERSVRTVGDPKAGVSQRIKAARLLTLSGAPQTVGVLLPLVDPAQPEALQLFALETLAGLSDPQIADSLADDWQRATPAVQEAIIRTLASRTPWARKLLDACRGGRIGAAQVPASTRAALANHDDEAVRQSARELFAADSGPRSDVIDRYQSALSLTGDPARGQQVYQRECTTCHQLGERGFQVGPNLALRAQPDRQGPAGSDSRSEP